MIYDRPFTREIQTAYDKTFAGQCDDLERVASRFGGVLRWIMLRRVRKLRVAMTRATWNGLRNAGLASMNIGARFVVAIAGGFGIGAVAKGALLLSHGDVEGLEKARQAALDLAATYPATLQEATEALVFALPKGT